MLQPHPHFATVGHILEHFQELKLCILYLISKLGKSGVQLFKRCANWSWNEEVMAIWRRTLKENASVAQHLNEFNTITNQLSSIEIDFDDEIHALIVLASFPNSWEAMRMTVSNSTGKEKLKYNDIWDLILAEEIRQRDAGETSGSGSALNLETRGKGNDRNSN